MKLVIVGGGSQSTPALFLAKDVAEHLHALDVTLVGRSREKLAAVARAIGVLTEPARYHVAISQELATVLPGTDVVVLQARFGGYDGRTYDERFPLSFDIPGDEGLGPGGLAGAWRSWPQLRELLSEIERCAPQATVVLLTSPLGVLTRCAVAAFPALRLFGLCELPWTTLQDVCAVTGSDPYAVTFDYAGTNHLGWFDRIDANGRDLIEGYSWSRANATGFPSMVLIETLRAVPLKYFRLHYDFAASVEKQKASVARGAVLAALESEAIAAFGTRERASTLSALARRPAPWYAHAVAPFLGGALGIDSSTPLFLTTRNGSYLPELADDDVVEIPHRYLDGVLHPIYRRNALSPRLTADLVSFVEYERAAASAVLQESHEGLVEALLLHPWVSTRATAAALAGAVYAGTDPVAAKAPR